MNGINMKVIIDGIEYIPKKKISETQGYTDEELILRSQFEANENIDMDEYQLNYDEKHRVW